MKGFRIKTYDKYEKIIDATDDFSGENMEQSKFESEPPTYKTFALDATNFAAFPIDLPAKELYTIDPSN